MMPCCRRHQPRPRETFLDDPQLLGIRPAPTPASIYNVKATHLTTISKDIHTDSQLQTGKNRKAAVLGRVHSIRHSLGFLQRLKEREQAIARLEAGSLAALVRLELGQGCFLECEVGMQVGLRCLD